MITAESAVPATDSTVVWWLLLGVALVLLAGASLRRSPEGALTVVVRRGRVVRVAADWVVRLPGLESVHAWPTGVVTLPLTVRETTADDVEVRVLADVAVALPDPRAGAAYADPARTAERAAEELLAAAVRDRQVTGLLDERDGLAGALPRGSLGEAGEVTAVEVLELEVLLSPGADQLGRTGHDREPR